MDQECRKLEGKFKNATCEVEFVYKNKTMQGCQTDIPSPSSKQEECQKFLTKAKKEFKSWPKIDEFEIYNKESLDLLAKCYRQSCPLARGC